MTDWTDDELRDVRAGLVATAAGLEAELAATDAERVDVLRQTCLDEGDQAVRQTSLGLEDGQALRARAMLDQTRHVVERLDAGLYGVCEGCGAAIPRERLEVFPRATTCTGCARVARD